METEDVYFMFKVPHSGPSICEGDGVSLSYEEVEEVTQFNLIETFNDLAELVMDSLDTAIEMLETNPEDPSLDGRVDNLQQWVGELHMLRGTIEYMGYPIPDFSHLEPKLEKMAAKLLQLV